MQLTVLFVSFSINTIFKEKLLTANSTYTFNFHTLLISLQSLFCFGLVLINLKATSKNVHITKQDSQEVAVIAVLSLLTSRISYYAFSHMRYPALMLGTANKITPLLLINYFIYNRKIRSKRIISIVLTVVGVLSFMAFGTTEISERLNSLKGLLILIVNSFIENYVSTLQDSLNRREISNKLCLCHFHMFVFIFAAALTMMFTDELLGCIAFLLLRHNVVVFLAVFLVSYGVEQVILTDIADELGKDFSQYISMLRGILGILISMVFFRKTLTFTQWISILSISMGFLMDFIDRKRKPNISQFENKRTLFD